MSKGKREKRDDNSLWERQFELLQGIIQSPFFCYESLHLLIGRKLVTLHSVDLTLPYNCMQFRIP